MAKKFIPNAETCDVRIIPDRETEKAFGVIIGSNGKWTNPRDIYAWIAKSVCYIDADGTIYAPRWATRDFPFSMVANNIRGNF